MFLGIKRSDYVQSRTDSPAVEGGRISSGCVVTVSGTHFDASGGDGDIANRSCRKVHDSSGYRTRMGAPIVFRIAMSPFRLFREREHPPLLIVPVIVLPLIAPT